MVTILKTQLKVVAEKHPYIKSVQQVQILFKDKMKFYNENKVGKAYWLTPLQRIEAEYINIIDQPTHALAFNHLKDKHNQEIIEL